MVTPLGLLQVAVPAAFRASVTDRASSGPVLTEGKFPFAFFGGVAAGRVVVVILAFSLYTIRPRDSYRHRNAQCAGSPDPEACTSCSDCVSDYERALAAE